ncbi:hypothetical protein [Cellulomonas sp.]|uniref:hypothetical protein n=1 Tax=Cellulomonas sp. TaxID=40001 RepID=UPI002D51383A|nr:hypothetical protein [Cellulomonas sp.]HYQ76755.1 hypothetical protein [Cellulomonas sp.]
MSRHPAPRGGAAPRSRRRPARRRLPAPPRLRRAPALAVLVAAVALLAGVLAGTLATSAAFTNAARLDLGADGLGSSTAFDVVLVADDGTVRQAPDGDPLAVPVPGADALVPGRTVEVAVRVANNHPDLRAALAVAVAGTPVAGTPDITPWLRVTVLDADGTAVLGTGDPADGVALGTAGAAGVLAARGAEGVADGAAWSAGAAGSDRGYRVLVHYLDDPATEPLNGGRALLTVRVAAESTEAAA